MFSLVQKPTNYFFGILSIILLSVKIFPLSDQVNCANTDENILLTLMHNNYLL